MWQYLMNKVSMHGYGLYVWAAVFFSIACLLSYFSYAHWLFKNTIKRIRANIEMRHD